MSGILHFRARASAGCAHGRQGGFRLLCTRADGAGGKIIDCRSTPYDRSCTARVGDGGRGPACSLVAGGENGARGLEAFPCSRAEACSHGKAMARQRTETVGTSQELAARSQAESPGHQASDGPGPPPLSWGAVTRAGAPRQTAATLAKSRAAPSSPVSGCLPLCPFYSQLAAIAVPAPYPLVRARPGEGALRFPAAGEEAEDREAAGASTRRGWHRPGGAAPCGRHGDLALLELRSGAVLPRRSLPHRSSRPRLRLLQPRPQATSSTPETTTGGTSTGNYTLMRTGTHWAPTRRFAVGDGARGFSRKVSSPSRKAMLAEERVPLVVLPVVGSFLLSRPLRILGSHSSRSLSSHRRLGRTMATHVKKEGGAGMEQRVGTKGWPSSSRLCGVMRTHPGWPGSCSAACLLRMHPGWHGSCYAPRLLRMHPGWPGSCSAACLLRMHPGWHGSCYAPRPLRMHPGRPGSCSAACLLRMHPGWLGSCSAPRLLRLHPGCPVLAPQFLVCRPSCCSSTCSISTCTRTSAVWPQAWAAPCSLWVLRSGPTSSSSRSSALQEGCPGLVPGPPLFCSCTPSWCFAGAGLFFEPVGAPTFAGCGHRLRAPGHAPPRLLAGGLEDFAGDGALAFPGGLLRLSLSPRGLPHSTQGPRASREEARLLACLRCRDPPGVGLLRKWRHRVSQAASWMPIALPATAASTVRGEKQHQQQQHQHTWWRRGRFMRNVLLCLFLAVLMPSPSVPCKGMAEGVSRKSVSAVTTIASKVGATDVACSRGLREALPGRVRLDHNLCSLTAAPGGPRGPSPRPMAPSPTRDRSVRRRRSRSRRRRRRRSRSRRRTARRAERAELAALGPRPPAVPPPRHMLAALGPRQPAMPPPPFLLLAAGAAAAPTLPMTDPAAEAPALTSLLAAAREWVPVPRRPLPASSSAARRKSITPPRVPAQAAPVAKESEGAGVEGAGGAPAGAGAALGGIIRSMGPG